MGHSTSVPTEMGEQDLTPGEQRILNLLEQGLGRVDQRLDRMEKRLDRMDQRLDRMEQRQDQMDQRLDRMDQRLDRMEHRQEDMDQQLKELTLKVEKEAADSKSRDLQLADALQRLREEGQQRDVEFRSTMYKQMNTLRLDFCERFNQHDTRLSILEQTVERNCETLRANSLAIKDLQHEVRKLTDTVGSLADAIQQTLPLERRPTT